LKPDNFSVARRQRGLTLISTLIVASFLAFCLYLAFRTVPALNEYFAMQRIVGVIAADGAAGASPTQMRRSFERYAYTDDIVSVTGADLEIARASGVTYVDVAWERKVPVAGNVSLLLEFNVSSSSGRQ
tara:strand:- start:844 stop:1230 length:387 start_codon:yes stop_codon:yes gene_type:complete